MTGKCSQKNGTAPSGDISVRGFMDCEKTGVTVKYLTDGRTKERNAQ